MLSGSRNSSTAEPPRSLIAPWGTPRLSRWSAAACSGLQRLTVRDGETQVIQTHPVLVEAVLGRRDGAKPEQTGAEAVDHPAAQKRQLLTRLLVGV